MTYKEIVEIAERVNINKETIEKDWILGHFLNAMFEFKEIKANFVFKGGTCLKKCYFKNYRFSEDLDFTLMNSTFTIDEKLFLKIIEKVEKNSGAKFHLKTIKLQTHKDIPQGYEVTILFWGAYHKPNQRMLPVKRWLTKIKLDISFSEKVILKPEFKSILHFYPDSDIITNRVPVYPLNEIVAEKFRSLLQRNRPRDIYDLYFLYSIIKDNNYIQILNLLREKSENKSLKFCNFEDFINEKTYKNNNKAWTSSLKYHLPQGKLIDYDTAYKTVEKFIKLILKGQLIMEKLISFTIKAEKGFLKKPDINEGIYLTYNMLHKPAILGILGAIIGLEGYKENGVLPEYYQKLKDIPIGVKPIGDDKGNFQKTSITYNNTTGLASNEQGGNLIITEQTLIKPSYKIYLLLNLENKNQKQLYENIKNQKAEYLPYLGKNDYSLWWDKDEVEEYKWKKGIETNSPYMLSTVFIKDETTVKEAKVDDTANFDLLDFSNLLDEPRFVSFERLPVNFNETLFQYNYRNFAYTNFKFKKEAQLNNLFILNNEFYVQLY